MRLGGVIFLLCTFPFLRLSGQTVDTSSDRDIVPFKDRIAIRTNMVDWVLTTPNIAFDYDIVSTPYDKKSVGIGFRYNWNTKHTYIPKQVYNLFDVRADYRFYWRQQPFDNRNDYYGDWERNWLKTTKGWGKLRARANCFRAVENPKAHMSLFIGPYLSVSSFSIKLGTADDAKGRQGMAVGAGATGGVALPLYGYENGSALDLEFGGSIGWHFASYDLYVADIEANGYPMVGHRSKFVFYPLVTDARVSLVYRFRTIAKQHTEIDYDLIDRRYIAHLMEGEKKVVEHYNDSIKPLKEALDLRNEEIALYKQTVESEPGFNQVFALEYLTPYVYKMEAPSKYTRQNKDTLPKIHIESIEQITDPILLGLRKEIDSIPHMTSAQIDDEFIKGYNSISDAPNKKTTNRTEVIRSIYNQINTFSVEANNAKLVPGTFGVEAYTEQISKFNVKNQGKSRVDIVYTDSVRSVTMTENEKIERLNDIKRRAWIDARNRAKGIYTRRVEVFVDSLPGMVTDSVATDTVAADSIVVDSIKTDSVVIDSIKTDTIPSGDTPADTTMTAVIADIATEWYALRSKECLIREEEYEE